MSDNDLLYSDDEIDTEPQLIFLNTRAGRCLTEVVNDMFTEGDLAMDLLEEIPVRFNECMRRIVSEQAPNDSHFRVNAKLKEFHDLPSGASFVASSPSLSSPGVDITGSDLEVKCRFW